MNDDVGSAERRPLVSVCVATIGRSTLRARTLPSILAAGSAVEVVVAVGTGGIDGIEGIEGTVVTAPDVVDVDGVRSVVGGSGPGGSRNRAVAAARGEFVMFLDDDDALAPDWYGTVEALVSAPGTAIVTGTSVVCDPATGRSVPDRNLMALSELHGSHVGTFLSGTFVVRRDLFDAAGGYDERFRSSENWELAIRLLRQLDLRGERLVTTEAPLLHRYPARRPDQYRSRPVAELMLDKYRSDLAGLPRLRAQYQAQAGVGSARDGDLAGARRWLARSLVTRPGDARAWTRLATACLPPLARRRWRAYETAS